MKHKLSSQSTRQIHTYGGYFEAFMETLSSDQQQKVKYGLLLLKTQKTPQREIKKAKQIKKAYHERTR